MPFLRSSLLSVLLVALVSTAAQPPPFDQCQTELVVPKHLQNNPFFSERGVLGTLPLDNVRAEHVMPALQFHADRAEAWLKAHAAVALAETTFDNSLAELRNVMRDFDVVYGLAYSVYSVTQTEEWEAVAEASGVLNSTLENKITFDQPLFLKIKLLREHHQSALTPEQRAIVEDQYLRRKNGGAELPDAGKAQLQALNAQEVEQTVTYRKTAKESREAFRMWLKDERDVRGLPPELLDVLAKAAKDGGYPDGWLVTMIGNVPGDFLEYSPRRDLRERVTRAMLTQASRAPFNNEPNVLGIVNIRFEKARLLGYPDAATEVLSETMAKNPATVNTFLDRLARTYQAGARQDVEQLRAFAHQTDGLLDFQVWDSAYYSRRLQEQQFQYDKAALRPYFELQQTMEAVFTVIREYFGVEFRPRKDIASYHPDVQVFEAVDAKGVHLGVVYYDLFARRGKKDGAWQGSFRSRAQFRGPEGAWVQIGANYSKASDGKPSLLDFDDLRTLAHESGHMLHELLSRTHYPDLSGTSVRPDFVEFPSQLMEKIFLSPDSLRRFALHVETRKPMTEETIAKIFAALNFQVARSRMISTMLGRLDQAWHQGDPTHITDIRAFEHPLIEAHRFLPAVPRVVTTSFSHIMTGRYGANYHSYAWSDAYVADANEFRMTGTLSPREFGRRLSDTILSVGGTVDAIDAYRAFRGQDFDPDALAREDGYATAIPKP